MDQVPGAIDMDKGPGTRDQDQGPGTRHHGPGTGDQDHGPWARDQDQDQGPRTTSYQVARVTLTRSKAKWLGGVTGWWLGWVVIRYPNP